MNARRPGTLMGVVLFALAASTSLALAIDQGKGSFRFGKVRFAPADALAYQQDTEDAANPVTVVILADFKIDRPAVVEAIDTVHLHREGMAWPYRSSGVRPVFFAMRANMGGPQPVRGSSPCSRRSPTTPRARAFALARASKAVAPYTKTPGRSTTSAIHRPVSDSCSRSTLRRSGFPTFKATAEEGRRPGGVSHPARTSRKLLWFQGLVC